MLDIILTASCIKISTHGITLKVQVAKINTVKPVYSRHLRNRPNVSAIDRCPLYRGLTKSLLKSQQNPISRTVVFP